MERLGRKAEWFDTALVVRNVLGHLAHQETLALSMVNKLWHSEAKSALRAGGNTLAKLGSSEACKDFLQFTKMLDTLDIVPYAGFSITVDPEHSGPCARLTEDELDLLVLNVPTKILKIASSGTDRRVTCNAAVAIIDRLLHVNAHQLVELSINVPCSFVCVIVQRVANSCGFPRLKAFRLNLKGRVHGAEKVVQTVVRTAPSLEELQLGESPLEDGVFYGTGVLIEAVRLVCPLLVGSGVNVVLDKVESGLFELPANWLERVVVRSFKPLYGPTTVREVLEAPQMLLRNSLKTLETAEFDMPAFAQVILLQLPFTKLKKVQLTVSVRFLREQPQGLLNSIFCQDTWRRCFPRLRSLTLVKSCFRGSVKEFMAKIMTSTVPSRIKMNVAAEGKSKFGFQLDKLSIAGSSNCLPTEYWAFLGNLFSHINHVLIDCVMSEVEQALSHLVSVENLEVAISEPTTVVADGIFCGIHCLEVRELYQKDVEYLKAAHIVPSRPSILRLKNLSKLTIHQSVGAGMCNLTRVSTGICFSRIPNLAVRLIGPSLAWKDSKIQEIQDLMNDFPEIKIEIDTVQQYV